MNQYGRAGKRAVCAKVISLLLAVVTALAGLSSCSSADKKTDVTAVRLPKKSVTVQEGDTYTIYSLADPSTANPTFSYKSSDTSVAAVDDSGVVTAVKEGEATVTVSAGGKSASFAVTVKAKTSSSSVSSSLAVSDASWTNKQVPVLMFHSINNVPGNELCIPPALFTSEMEWLSTNGYAALSMDELYAHLNAHTALPDKVVVLTFDDGYTDFYTNAFPVLKKYGLNSTVFMITGKIGTSNYLTADQLKEVSQNNVDVEDHTVTHGYLSQMTYSKQYAELHDSKTVLEQITGKSVDYVSYPYGDYNASTLRATQAIGYKLGFRENGGTAAVTDPVLEVRRSYVSANDDLNAFIKIVQAK